MKSEDIDNAIDKGIAFLAEHQFPNGEFCTYVGFGEDLQEWCVVENANFETAIICSSLLPLKGNTLVDSMINKPIPFLKYQMLRGGVWDYFPVLHKAFSACPPDSDTISYISAFFKAVGAEFPDNTRILLMNRNRKRLFYTWFAPRFNLKMSRTYWLLILRGLKHPLLSFLFWKRSECTRKDIDAVVNANVLYYLGLTKDTAFVLSYLLKIIEDHKEADSDKWYWNPFVVYYCISRSYNKGIMELEPVKRPITERILAAMQPDGRIGNSAFNTALAINAILDFNYKVPELEQAIRYLLNTQSENGSWPRRVLFWSGPKKEMGYGSEELTTGFCLEALARYKQLKTTELTTGQAAE